MYSIICFFSVCVCMLSYCTLFRKISAINGYSIYYLSELGISSIFFFSEKFLSKLHVILCIYHRLDLMKNYK
ncbi:hypothetical protein KSF78_0009424 [Schistosoma japonicum]|nr:hypothetical protein KSF78_0009424 [Schistosoma japonicum]